MKFSIEDRLRGKVFVGVGVVNNVKNNEYPSELLAIINEAIKEVRSRYSLDKLKDDPVIRHYRDFYWHELGIDLRSRGQPRRHCLGGFSGVRTCQGLTQWLILVMWQA
ncbi:hypothetical protein [Vulcanisaeta sp. JCM 14467]|uniref:hypothetical protein n=1 Tax=Vulcanisaeta sp. JCM 14467 TaxID=1295370 RepID=UPI004037991D